uniref:PH domain-containing protein n=1 Tax=Nosema pernyi TaxID=1112939 RepID=X5E6B9_9MICR|nr:hypothetical protein NP_09E01 [Nosema pernyi]
MEQRRNLEENLENVYLSPQSVSSRIKSINDEIKNNINRNREEMKCNKVKDEEEVRSIKSQGSISVDNRISIGNRIKIDLLEKKEIVKGVEQKDSEQNYNDQGYGKVMDLVKNYSMRLNHKEEGSSVKEGGSSVINPFTKRHNHLNKNPFNNNPLTEDNSFNNTSLKNKNPFNNNIPTVKNSPFNNTPLRNKPPFNNTPLTKDSPFNKNLYSISNNPLSVLSLNENSFPSRPFPSLSLTPINVIYAPKNPPTLEKKVDPPSPKKSFNKTLTSSFSFYGPGTEITEDITFNILNTIYKFENGIEDTIYYFKIESKNDNNPISWIIKKTLSQIRDFIKKDLDLSYNPYDKKIRDNVIITILNGNLYDDNGINNNGNGGYINNDHINNNDHHCINHLQFFVLTNITKDLDQRSNYLLMSNPLSPILEPFNFRLVGQALVCYDKTNRVKKIFLLKGCKVEIHSEYSFKIASLENNVILYSSCTVERDAWIRDIEEFIK